MENSFFFDPLNSYVAISLDMDLSILVEYLKKSNFLLPFNFADGSLKKILLSNEVKTLYGKSIVSFIRFVVLKNGVKIGNKIIKKSSGYNFASLFVYSSDLLENVSYVGFKIFSKNTVDSKTFLKCVIKKSLLEKKLSNEIAKSIS